MTIASMGGPCSASVGFGVDDDFATSRAKGCGRVVKGHWQKYNHVDKWGASVA